MKKSVIGMRGARLIAVVVAFFALLVISNIALKNLRLDLTENKIYTLTEGTRSILSTLEDPINVYLFFSDKASEGQSDLRNYYQRLREVLDEYKSYADGKLIVHYIDPEPFSEEEDRATELGIASLKDEKSGNLLYFGLAATNSVDDLEVIPFMQPNREIFFEYDLNKIIYSLKRLDKPVIGLLSTINMYAVQNNPQRGGANTETWAIIQQLEQLFEVRLVDQTSYQIDPEIDVLMVVHPRNLSDDTLYAIDQYILGGGRGLFFVDSFSETAPMPKMQLPGLGPRASSLNRLFRAWGGFQVNQHFLIGDFKTALLISDRTGNRMRHPAMLGLTKDLFAQDDIVMHGLNSINMATVSYFEKDEEEKMEYKTLITTSDEAVSVSNQYIGALSDPDLLRQGFKPTGEKFVLAARVKGVFKSAFAEPPKASSYRGSHLSQSNEPVNIVVVADTDMLGDHMWSQSQNFFGHRLTQAFASNRDFVISLVDNMLGSNELIGIRSRVSFSRPFTRVKAIEAAANRKYHERHQALTQKLNEAESKLRELKANENEDNAVSFSMERKRQVEQYKREALKTRKELREVKHQLSQDIENLGRNLKITNIILVPTLVALIAAAIGFIRMQRRKRRTSR